MEWFDEYKSARISDWQTHALDRMRFRKRIEEANQKIGWIFAIKRHRLSDTTSFSVEITMEQQLLLEMNVKVEEILKRLDSSFEEIRALIRQLSGKMLLLEYRLRDKDDEKFFNELLATSSESEDDEVFTLDEKI